MEPPNLSFTDNTAHALWNGAIAVRQWRLRHGPESNAMTTLSTTDWSGYDTPIPLPAGKDGYYQLQALDAAGTVIGQTVPITR